MSRFYFSMKEKPVVVIEYTEDLKDHLKPVFEQMFGISFLRAEIQIENLFTYTFIPNDADFDIVANAFKELAESKIVKECDIEIHFN